MDIGRDGVNDPERLYIPKAVKLGFARTMKTPNQNPGCALCLSGFGRDGHPLCYQVECQTGTKAATNRKQ
jgi:hypothetical protein